MVRGFLSYCSFAVVGLLSVICASQSALSQTATTESDFDAGKIVEIGPAPSAGKLMVKQRGENSTDATLNMTVRRKHLLDLADKAYATVRCFADGSMHPLQTGPQGVPCTKPGVEKSGRSTIPTPRGGDTANSLFPVVISPRATLLLSPRPTLRWSPVTKVSPGMPRDGSTSYNVAVYTDNMKLVWSKEVVTRTELPYPLDKPDLTPGEYLFIVSTEVASSDKEQGGGLGFTVLPQCEKPKRAGTAAKNCLAEKVRNQVAEIRKMKLSEESRQLLVIDLYTSYELYAEAIEAMEGLVKINGAPALVHQLGELYAQVGLNREAAKHFLTGLTRSREAKDDEGTATILRALARAYQDLGSFDEARVRLDEAIKAFEKLGDTEVVAELKRQRAALPAQQKDE